MLTFTQAVKHYNGDQINELSGTQEGYRFLLLRSLSRSGHLNLLAEQESIDISAVDKRSIFEFIFNSAINTSKIENFIKKVFSSERATRLSNEAALISELYKMQEFNWGGLHQNSLDKTIVNNYVKKVISYDRLNEHIDNELLTSMRGYVRCSWYNHWTSIMIEDIFKEHAAVLPAVGLVKKLDFFIHKVPFDLKVTYLPEGYVKDMRKAAGLRPELTLLKQKAKAKSLVFDKTLKDADLLAYLWEMIAEQPDEDAKQTAIELREFRRNLVDNITSNPAELIKWLYENQGERRFDSSNRIFLILVNESNFFESWQLKRNRKLMSNQISAYLDTTNNAVGHDICFNWEGEEYNCKADVVLVRFKSV